MGVIIIAFALLLAALCLSHGLPPRGPDPWPDDTWEDLTDY